jgi:5-methylcytosine-specific restriction endonuclease McrA
MSNDTVCAWNDCNTALVKKPGRGRPPKWCADHKGTAARLGGSADSLSTFCLEPGCGLPHRAKGKCRRHYNAMLRAEGREKPQEWSEVRQENRERRRARMMGVYVGPKAPRFKIADRDGWCCGLCGGHIPRVVRHGHPLYLTIDHIVPLSRGGEHSPSNVQAAHATCNYTKGDRLDTAA